MAAHAFMLLWKHGRAACLVAALGLSLGACSGEAQPGGQSAAQRERLIGLSTSLPIYWPEAGNIGDMLGGGEQVHWARTELEALGEVRPLDTLTGGKNGALGLPADALLLLVQPYPFSPDELVALDEWVRAGGRVLVFADPLATFHSDFALGDRRRPQDIAMLSPILERWGLELAFDREQPAGQRMGEAFGVEFPVNLPGALHEAQGTEANCRIAPSQLAARCRVGQGQAIVLADSALFDAESHEDSAEDEAARAQSLRGLVALIQRTS